MNPAFTLATTPSLEAAEAKFSFRERTSLTGLYPTAFDAIAISASH